MTSIPTIAEPLRSSGSAVGSKSPGPSPKTFTRTPSRASKRQNLTPSPRGLTPLSEQNSDPRPSTHRNKSNLHNGLCTREVKLGYYASLLHGENWSGEFTSSPLTAAASGTYVSPLDSRPAPSKSSALLKPSLSARRNTVHIPESANNSLVKARNTPSMPNLQSAARSREASPKTPRSRRSKS